jgi:hypothetical protein
VNPGSLIPIVLLTLFVVAFTGGASLVLLVIYWRRKNSENGSRQLFNPVHSWFFWSPRVTGLRRPTSWLAIRSRNLSAVQTALGLNNPRPCTWTEALIGEQRLFVAPPVNGWILVIGSDLPEPADDIDVCFRFLLNLSLKLGHIQFFNANPAWNHHAWVRMEAGRVMRAYAWADGTLWNQGIKTPAELALGLKCFHYLATAGQLSPRQLDIVAANTEKVPSLAQRWSLDPATVEERMFAQASGIAGVPSHLH